MLQATLLTGHPSYILRLQRLFTNSRNHSAPVVSPYTTSSQLKIIQLL